MTAGPMDETEIRHRCFMDGIDWQHHLEADCKGTLLFPDVPSLKDVKTCIDEGGCGVVEVEVRLIRWVEPQDLNF
jgi:hypothetical protein